VTGGTEKALFVTPWTGGPHAVAVAVFADRAVVGHWNRSKQTVIPLRSDQVAELKSLSVENFDPLCEQAEAVAVADRLNQISGGYLDGFTRMSRKASSFRGRI
jgi:hypothetical protein